MKDVLQNVYVVALSNSTNTAAAATATRVGATVDCSGYKHVTFIANIASASTNADPVSLYISGSQTTDATNFTAIPGTGTVTNLPITMGPLTSGAVAVLHLDLKGQKGRYFNVSLVPGTLTATSPTNTDGVSSNAIAILGWAEQTPLKNSLIGNAVQIIVGGNSVA